jgi:membrane-bound lytic murein transglycosylase F
LAAIQFFTRLRNSGELEQLLERYYGHIDEGEHFDYVNLRDFRRYREERLPKYRNYFEKVATRYHLDWRLLAAIGYEESQWHPSAVSQTGVRGIMMLTKTTAQEMGVTNRDDPYQSIEGGTKYFLSIRERIREDIPEPDRTWFTLAAYNVGLGHLRDAMKLTEEYGDNPTRWIDVKKHLPKLSVRRFYDMLVRFYPQPEMVSVPPQSFPNKPDSVPATPIL